jgi:hypothetical protein
MKGGCVVSKNLLIVEGESDKHFVERLKTFVESDFEVSPPIFRIDEYNCLGGKDKLKLKLDEIKSDIEKGNFNKIGIMLDADKEGIQKRVSEINAAVKIISDDLEIIEPNQWYRSESLDVDISCHILNVNGFGELETLLKEIKSQDSTFADCLNGWQTCLQSKNKTITPKDFDKFWINVYERYDCCNKKEKSQADKNCNSEISLKEKDIWNFSHSALTDLKNYLAMFN